MNKQATPFTTKELQDLIGHWLSNPNIRDDLSHHSKIDDPNGIIKGYGGCSDMTAIAYLNNSWQVPITYTSEQLEEYIWDLWSNGDHWMEGEKSLIPLCNDEPVFGGIRYLKPLKRGVRGSDHKHHYVPYFYIDMVGDADIDLVTKYFNDQQQAGKCIFRCFVPDNQLADHYRLEVTTTPDDTEVIGWTVIGD